ncbi:uracil-DNA glycosylase [Candidatus Peregrinibacteria bacterium]|nr:MAG: uracil-DNA glycosylase [Candidatus Peregrinibacteria bacterium]
MDVKIEFSWKERLEPEFEKPYFKALTDFVKWEYLSGTIFPHPKNVFHAFELCPFDQVKVVILGQDPYHGPGQAHGLCFSVRDGIQVQPSLQNIYKEIHDDLGLPISTTGNLEPWAQQGVFLLNATLTVRAHQAGSHQGKGWEEFTDVVIKTISDQKEHVVFLLWGAYAGRKSELIDSHKHLILKAPHPSPLSSHRGFFGCKHFSQANAYLKSKGMEEVDWGI